MIVATFTGANVPPQVVCSKVALRAAIGPLNDWDV